MSDDIKIEDVEQGGPEDHRPVVDESPRQSVARA